jgi:glucokinase
VGQLEDLDVGANLKRLLRRPVLVVNDANAAAVGESWVGAGKNAKSLFLFTLGTGVGGSLVTETGVWEGADGIAGEIGHTVIDMNGPRCPCGKRGCLETLVSATAIVRDYTGLTKRRSVKDPGSLTAKVVFDRARRGDRDARRVVDGAARALGTGIANVFNLLNPELILLGGGVSRAGRTLIDPAVRHARDMVFPPLKDQLKVIRASLGDDAGLIGAARLAFKHLQ